MRDSDITSSLVKRAVESYRDDVGVSIDIDRDRIGVGNNSNQSNNSNHSNNNNQINNSNQRDESEKSKGTPVDSKAEEGLSKYLSSSFLNKLKAKEDAVNMSRSIVEYSNSKHQSASKVKDYQNLADRLKTIFMTQKSVSVSLSELSNKIYNTTNSFKLTFSLENIKNIIISFKDIFPGWITVIDHSSLGTLVKMDRQYAMVQIKEKLGDPAIIQRIQEMI